jgi:hypothetical protein
MQTPRTYPRYRYLISVIAFIDFPLWVEARHRAWAVAMILLLLMAVLAGRRFAEIGWHRAWAIPWCFVTISPLALLYFFPTVNPWLALICVAVLQVPAMLWPPMNRPTDGQGMSSPTLSEPPNEVSHP